jgi:YYY domain-containing protein
MPYFTFLYGDLHAHMISMPMQFLIILFLLHEVLYAGRQDRRRWIGALLLAVGAIAVGMLRGINTWDWPTYLLLSVLGLGYAWWLRWRSFSRASLVAMFLYIGGFLALSVWLSRPYTRWYAAIYSSASPWDGTKTPIWAYWLIHGHFLFLLVSLCLWETARWLRSVQVIALRGRALWLYIGLGALATVLLASVVLYFAGWSVSLILIPLLVWCIVLFFRDGQSLPMQFVFVLAALAIAVTLGVEYIVIDGDIGRQNTVFKFYLQGWLMYSIVGGVVVAWLLDSVWAWRPALRNGWYAALGGLIFITALYPLTSTGARALDRMVPELGPVLDGMTYMQQADYYEVVDSAQSRGEVLQLEDDYNVIRWLQDNIVGTPVIMEAQSEREYLWGSRISIYTGLPSVVGWNWHQRQQRTFDPMPRMVMQRVANVNAFYETTDMDVAANILQHYEVQYVIVSALERARYPLEGLLKLEDMTTLGVLEAVHREGDSVVYEVNLPATRRLALGILDDTQTVAGAN